VVQRQGDIVITETERKSVFIFENFVDCIQNPILLFRGGGKPEYPQQKKKHRQHALFYQETHTRQKNCAPEHRFKPMIHRFLQALVSDAHTITPHIHYRTPPRSHYRKQVGYRHLHFFCGKNYYHKKKTHTHRHTHTPFWQLVKLLCLVSQHKNKNHLP
jgi:hypothetical protein